MDVKALLVSYLKELDVKYGEQEGVKVLIIKTMILLYPILKQLGLGVAAPVALVINSINIAEAIMHDLYGVFTGCLSSIALPAKEMKKIYIETENEVKGVTYIRSPNSIPNLRMLQTVCQDGSIQGNIYPPLPVIIFPGAIAEETKEFLSGQMSVTLKSDITSLIFHDAGNGVSVSYELIQYIQDNWASVRLELSRLPENQDYRKAVADHPGIEMFFAAEKVLSMMCEGQDFPPEERNFYSIRCHRALNNIVNEWRIVSGGSEWLDILRDSILKSVPTVPGIADRHQVPAKVANEIEFWPLYDDDFYYLPYKLFDEACTAVCQSISTRDMKGLLVENGILVGEGKNRQYLTVKVPAITEYGAIIEPRRLRLHRKWLDLDGDLTWKELIDVKSENEGA